MHHQTGGTVYWAQGAAAKPNWIFPFASISYFSVTNLTQFEELMYRPLYYFGTPGQTSPNVDYQLSLANAPVWSNGDKTITINLKGWKFEDGQTVDAQSVIFWMNMMKVEGASNWAGYASGSGQYPGNIVSYSAASPTALSVTFHLTESFSTEWYLYNELSQITPMPEAWDVTSLSAAPGSGGCGAVLSGNMTGAEPAIVKACTKVWTFDTDDGGKAKNAVMAANVDTYGTNPLWKDGADGPWYLSAFNGASGEATFLPNSKYSGPQRPIISKFVEVPYTSTTAEFDALAAGGSGAPQVGYLPPENTPQKPAGSSPTSVGANASQLSSTYNLSVAPTWQINYFPENYDSTLGANGHAGKVFSQLYFRQALQELVNQPGMITTYFKGYGVPTYGPAPVYPKNNFAAGKELETNGPYPFSETNAIDLLKSHGWDVKPGGTTTCASAGSGSSQCGAGIPSGTPLTFQMLYVSGTPALTDVVQYEVSEWAKAGIQVTTKQGTFDDVLGTSVPCIPTKDAACQHWDMANWGGGWLYSPDYLPTGEEIFHTGAGSNTGNYDNPTNDAMIEQTNRSSDLSYFYSWENYMAEQLPVVWQPLSETEPEVAKNLGGVLPFNALLNLDPEYWYFTSSS